MNPGSGPQDYPGIHIGTVADVLENDSGALARSRGPGDSPVRGINDSQLGIWMGTRA